MIRRKQPAQPAQTVCDISGISPVHDDLELVFSKFGRIEMIRIVELFPVIFQEGSCIFDLLLIRIDKKSVLPGSFALDGRSAAPVHSLDIVHVIIVIGIFDQGRDHIIAPDLCRLDRIPACLLK